MLDETAAYSLTARYVFPVAGPPLPGGCITVQGERIVAVEARSTANCIDLGNVALLPGLVNAHTHLEFSDCQKPLGRRGQPLPEWIREVIATRRSDARDPAAAIAAGLAESLQAGTTTVGEIATGGWTAESLSAAALDLTVFYELLGLPAERATERLADAARFVEESADARSWHPGISPHAPYSVHPELVVGLVRLAMAHRLPVAMHLAESPEEIELLTAGSGPFRDMLQVLGVWEPTAIPHGTHPLEYLQILAEAPRALVVHGNYLNIEELEYLAVHAERMTLVYCPRTHDYFGHRRHPLPKLMALGGRVALGTDSRASNPDLSLLAEMRHVARGFPELAPREVLRLGTIAGAQALGRAHEIGTLEPGKLANLAVIPLEELTAADPHELIFSSELAPTATYYRGRKIQRS